MSRAPKRKADAEATPPTNSSGGSDGKEKEMKEAKVPAPDPLAEAQRWFSLAIAEHNQRRQALEAERQAWESERQWMVSNIRQIPEEDEVELNIGGTVFTTTKQTLTSPFAKGSMLEAMFSGRHNIRRNKKGQVFIDRDSTHFRHVLNFLRTGVIDLDDTSIVEEANFYQLVLPKPSPPPVLFSFHNSLIEVESATKIRLSLRAFAGVELMPGLGNAPEEGSVHRLRLQVDNTPEYDSASEINWFAWVGVYEKDYLRGDEPEQVPGSRKWGCRVEAGDTVIATLDVDKHELAIRRNNAGHETRKMLPKDLTLPLRWALECGHFTLLSPEEPAVIVKHSVQVPSGL